MSRTSLPPPAVRPRFAPFADSRGEDALPRSRSGKQPRQLLLEIRRTKRVLSLSLSLGAGWERRAALSIFLYGHPPPVVLIKYNISTAARNPLTKVSPRRNHRFLARSLALLRSLLRPIICNARIITLRRGKHTPTGNEREGESRRGIVPFTLYM